VRIALPLTVLQGALDDASEEGYTLAGFSGGEPLMYEHLRSALEHAHARGMVTTVTSNGTLLDERRLALLHGAVDLLAISLDGVPDSHNRMRASPHAFEAMARRLEAVRRSGIPYGFIFTLTLNNVHELDWVGNFALDQGARLLQIHPLEEVGRAQQMLEGSRPDDVETAFAFLEVQRLRQVVGDRLVLQFDMVDRRPTSGRPRGHCVGPA
jgi:MoaA/NifB/PqqE/SkfB family radical SAM enzyme